MSRSVTGSALVAAIILAFCSLPAAGQTSLISTGSVWKHFDQGFEVSGWKSLLFNDSAWPAGPGQLGFGDGDEATVVARTNSAGLTNIAFYFRHTFNVADPSLFTNLMVRLRRDDGVIVYLNETEVFRNNMASGPVDANTLARTAAADDGNGFFAGPVSPAVLNVGDNQFAVEIHQSATSSTDVTFDLELLGNVTFQPPTVNFVSPTAGETMGGSAFSLVAAASDLDGVVASVEFFDGNTWLGAVMTPTNAGYVLPWISVSPGLHLLTTVAVDSTGLSATSAPVSVQVLPALIPRGSSWRFLDDGTEPNPSWKETSFDHSSWPIGLAQFGYGDGDETTVLRRTDAAGNTNVTFYFRHEVSLVGPLAASNLVVRLHRDDGAIVYLNGVEVFRNNVPLGLVTNSTFAVAAIEDEGFHGAQVDAGLLISGNNVVAVEIHQASATSSDVSFDLELLTDVVSTPPAVRLASPTNGSTFLGPLSLVLTALTTDVDSPVASVTFLDGSNTLSTVGVDISGGAVDGYVFAPGQHTLHAIATDAMGLNATSAPVTITVIPAPVLTTLIATGAVWRYYDTNAAPGTNWRTAEFDDSSWRSGPAILGSNNLGPGSIFPATSINFGPVNNRYLTAYFRHSFNITNAAAVTNLAFRVLRDDGLVAYLNGVELFRMNMNTGDVTYATVANVGVSGTNELFYAPTNLVVSPGQLLEGSNIFAVELHQNAGTTTDAAFDLGLVAISPPSTRPRLQIQLNGANVRLTWDAPGFVLGEAGLPEGPYIPNAGAVSPHDVVPTLPVRFYRLIQQ